MLSRAFARRYLSLMLGTSILCSPALAQEQQEDSSTRTENTSATDALALFWQKFDFGDSHFG